VVFTHGLCLDHRSFAAQVAAVTGRYRILTWDMRGHGQSQSAGERFSIPLAVDDLLALLQRLEVDRAAFVGHSAGSYVVQELAFRHPRWVQALVLAGGTCITWRHGPLERWLMRHAADLLAPFPYRWIKLSSIPTIASRPEAQQYALDAYSLLSREAFLALVRGASTCLHAEPGYRIQRPLLLLHGDGDSLGDTRKLAPRWAAVEPNCLYLVVPDARHLAMLDNPKFFTEVLLEFLAKWLPAPGALTAQQGPR
jgi:pimeloyl-ACP methyl ester carboxylesterase